MSINHLFTKNLIIRRLSTVSGNKKQFYSTATVDGALQEMSREAREKLGILEERTFIAYMDIEENVIEGDHIIDEYGTEYFVKEVTKKDYGINQHLELILEEHNN